MVTDHVVQSLYIHDLDRVLKCEAGNGVSTAKAMRDGEAAETRMAPEGRGGWFPEDAPNLPRRREDPLLDIPLRCHGAPEPAHARGPGEVGRREELEDEPEEVSGEEGREVGVHGGNSGGG